MDNLTLNVIMASRKRVPAKIQSELFPLADDGPSRSLIGVDELNMINVPFAVAWDRGVYGTDEKKHDLFETVTLKNGRRMPRGWTIHAGSAGFPTPSTERLIIALLKVSADQGAFSSTNEAMTYRFNIADVLRLMNFDPDSMRDRRRLLEDLEILYEVSVEFHRSWYDKLTSEYWKLAKIRILSGYKLGDAKPGRPRESVDRMVESQLTGSCEITWGPEFFKSLAVGYIKRLDMDMFFSLKKPIAGKLFRIIDKAAYRKVPGDEIVFPLVSLVGNLAMRPAPPSQWLRRMTPSVEELIEYGVIRSWRHWKVKEDNGTVVYIGFVLGRRSGVAGTTG